MVHINSFVEDVEVQHMGHEVMKQGTAFTVLWQTTMEENNNTAAVTHLGWHQIQTNDGASRTVCFKMTLDNDNVILHHVQKLMKSHTSGAFCFSLPVRKLDQMTRVKKYDGCSVQL